ncbi:putative histidine kinase [Desulfotignum phosphitoxidans DSM 13687]|jgi:two-component system sensor histidine kinase EvgS|uniref:Putative histidine kinase n=1 Tax=Desulfotignum phosphitoxidans DSM 13687 TaxID=1286635 RepID=S0G429_9BACT|nr:putative histidine kinase [Desulfotignum phosphitoxidans DSM 13687]
MWGRSKHKIGVILIVLLWVGAGYAGQIDLSLDDMALTPAETAWLEKNPVISAGGPLAFPPFHFFDDQGNVNGISAEYLFSIMEALGLEVTVRKKLPWTEVLEKARSGQIDIIACAAKTAERETYLSFSIPYLSFPLVILTRKDAPFIGGIQDLHGKTLAVIEKNATIDWLKKDGIAFVPYYVNSPAEQLRAVAAGRVDAVIENLAAATHIIQTHGLTNVKIAAPTPYESYDLHMAVPKTSPELLGILNKAIGAITPAQHMRIKNDWLSVRYEHGLQKSDILKWVATVVFMAAVILFVVISWNRTLKKEIAAKKKLIEELKDAMAEIKTLKGIVPICSGCKKIRNDKGFWNHLEVFIEEHSQASFSHGLCPECEEKLYGGQPWYSPRKKQSTEKQE